MLLPLLLLLLLLLLRSLLLLRPTPVAALLLLQQLQPKMALALVLFKPSPSQGTNCHSLSTLSGVAGGEVPSGCEKTGVLTPASGNSQPGWVFICSATLSIAASPGIPPGLMLTISFKCSEA